MKKVEKSIIEFIKNHLGKNPLDFNKVEKNKMRRFNKLYFGKYERKISKQYSNLISVYNKNK